MPHLPTPTAADGVRGPDYARRDREGAGGDDLITTVARLFPKEKAGAYLKTPTANLGSNGAPQNPEKRKAGGHGPTLEDEVCFLLNVDPETDASEGEASPPEWWAQFGPVVNRWEGLRKRAAPVPIEVGPRGGVRLAPRFAEWMMGLPAGWVTDVPDMTRGEQLARIGNGVCPQQAYAAFLLLLDA